MGSGKLALFGGQRHIKEQFKPYNSIGQEELDAAIKVLKTGVLSKFIGAHHQDFLGGPKVKEFESACRKYFKVKHAITVNSWTSGLIAAVGSLDLSPGDEIIVPTWTMCATATAVIHWNAIPIFADIETETFNIDPTSVVGLITPRTKAIMVVDIFGHPADFSALKKIADKYNLKIISDTAQAPSAIYQNHFASTESHIGGFSLNYHKHIHTGEGGVLITNDDHLAERMQLIRNHGEAAVSGMQVDDISNILGYNFRLGEIECAIGIEQLKKLDNLVKSRQRIAQILTTGLKDFVGIRTPIVKPGCTHVYYIYPMILDTALLGVSRKKIISALNAEGIEGLMDGYANIHLLPMYQKKIAYGKQGFPWNSEICGRRINYDKGICPNAERLHDDTFLGYQMCLHDLSDNDAYSIVQAFEKVWNNMNSLK